MKKNDFNLKNVIAIAICLCSLSVFAGLALTNAISAENQPVAELSFIYTRQAGSGSNQFAVWIEDNKGRYITTLYATGFTANGGWERRETSIPVWVRQSGIAGMEKTRIDAITGATPSAGSLTYRWDGTDSHGVALPSGRYVICLEGTLRGDNQIICRAPIQTGRRRPSEAKVSIEYIGTPPGTERDMISNVTARTLK